MSSDVDLTNISAMVVDRTFRPLWIVLRGDGESVYQTEKSWTLQVHMSLTSLMLISTYIQHPQTLISNLPTVCSNIIHSIYAECTHSRFDCHISTYMYLLLNWADKYLMPITKRWSWSFLSAFAFLDKWLFTWISKLAAERKIGCKAGWGCTNVLDEDFSLMLAAFFKYQINLLVSNQILSHPEFRWSLYYFRNVSFILVTRAIIGFFSSQ